MKFITDACHLQPKRIVMRLLQQRPGITIADAILDGIVHNAQRLELKGDSLRKKRAVTNDSIK
jgi:hypothetical protein